MKTIKGPAIFLAQFCSDDKPFNNLKDIAQWAKTLGYKATSRGEIEHSLKQLE